MAKKLPYAGWVRITLEPLTPEHQQELRGSFFSDTGRVKQYDNYKKYCIDNNYEYDGTPDGYWEAKEEPWHKPVGWGMVATGYLGMMLLSAMGSGIRTRRR